MWDGTTGWMALDVTTDGTRKIGWRKGSEAPRTSRRKPGDPPVQLAIEARE